MSDPALSAVCLLGARHERLPRLRAAMAAQTAAADLEVVFVGGAEDAATPLDGGPRTRRVPWPPGLSFGEARAEGARQASGAIAAFLLDNSYPEPGWAEALIDAYRDRSRAAVGYGYRNANPATYASRATFFAHFGPWESARPGESGLLAGNLVSYRRRDLIALGSELGDLLEVDSSLHRRFRGSGRTMAAEPRAVVSAECYESVLDAVRANEVYGRLLAARRARLERWPVLRRAVNGLFAPVVATTVRIARIWRGSEGRGELVRCLPAVVAISIGWALGESRGYLTGEGGAAARLTHWELDAVRDSG